MRTYAAEIVNIGDELLAGHTLNSNASYISAELKAIGIPVLRHSVIPDERNAIVNTMDNLLETTSHVFITGGLGPTGDDRTKAVLSDYFGGKLVFMPEIYAEIEARFRARGRIPSPGNREQAFEPDNALLIPNRLGTAKGLLFRRGKRSFYVMPGVPYEMESMMQESVLPMLGKETGVIDAEYQINTFGIPESELSDRINARFPGIEDAIVLGYYPSVNGITLRLRGTNAAGVKDYRDGIVALFPDAVYSCTGEPVAAQLIGLCREAELQIVTAESCSGGLISDMITDIPGSSKVFNRGYIVYSNAAKNELLGISETLLQEHGAVSEACVTAMARGAIRVSGCGLALAASGIAGPGGGSPEKPVGTVWIAAATKSNLITQRINFDRGRRPNKLYAANAALHLARRLLLSLKNKDHKE
ncbi:MAG: CinA family nicotinamide mononucleotide deamidase-related protein [Candidatus Marinimicrobia bacterium]|nr:CinA family nicotinamide mononucleotide deamidase-related protein [Candidatus Neomarinimicrobiota bacterium]MDD4961460.1 CinA family nicotinamide mononucleotide deamidase-related protein [Candidatus Neomarinimicrobiota bacterium]MDD5709036.1 CinA family nicotinamide mononucleotide deamidase-related protein [Candidatus Neomarinimicrobiota bacterium]